MKKITETDETSDIERRRDEAIIAFEKREELENAWREYQEEIATREPAQIHVVYECEIQTNTLPF